MISTDSPILVFGAGSIGERHLGILQKLGYLNLWVYRQRNLPLRTIDAASLQNGNRPGRTGRNSVRGGHRLYPHGAALFPSPLVRERGKYPF